MKGPQLAPWLCEGCYHRNAFLVPCAATQTDGSISLLQTKGPALWPKKERSGQHSPGEEQKQMLQTQGRAPHLTLGTAALNLLQGPQSKLQGCEKAE